MRAALGIDRLDLLGDSYGTYLMPTYVARHPDHDYHRDFDYADSVADRKADFEKAVSRMKTKKFLPFSPKAWLTRDDYDTGACLE